MSFDDPFKQLRDLNRQFDEFRVLGKSPLDEVTAAFRQQQELYENSVSRLLEPLSKVSTFPSLAAEAQEYLNSVIDQETAIAASSIPKEVASLGKHWAELDAFYGARDFLSESILDSQAVVAAIADSASLEVARSKPLAVLQQSLQQQVQGLGNLRGALPALKLDEQLADLVAQLEVPETLGALTNLGELFQANQSLLLPSDHLFEQFRSLSISLELPYFEIAAQQWTEALQGIAADVLVAQPILGSTLASIAAVAAMAETADGEQTENVFLVWKRMVDAQVARFGPRPIPSWLQGFLMNLLFLLLGILISNQGMKDIAVRLERIEGGQDRIVREVEPETDQHHDDQEERESELELLREALELAMQAAGEFHRDSNLVITSVNLRLRSDPSTGATILMTIPQGQAVEVLEQSDEWSKVEAMNFTVGEISVGWVASRYLEPWDSFDD